jgi:hypothetical protein
LNRGSAVVEIERSQAAQFFTATGSTGTAMH